MLSIFMNSLGKSKGFYLSNQLYHRDDIYGLKASCIFHGFVKFNPCPNLLARINLKSLLTLILITLSTTGLNSIIAQESNKNDTRLELGKNLFNTECLLCHKFEEPSYGPDLRITVKSRTPEWFIQFTRSQQELIKAKDSIATKLFYDYNQVVHTEHDLTKDQIMAIIGYLEKE